SFAAAGALSGAACSSMSEFQAPQSGQRPSHLCCCPPHSWHANTVFGGLIWEYYIGDWVIGDLVIGWRFCDWKLCELLEILQLRQSSINRQSLNRQSLNQSPNRLSHNHQCSGAVRRLALRRS